MLWLLIFGYAKGYFTGNKPFRSALRTAALIDAIASAAACGMAKAVHP
jgi:VIT1/CCC1 family predicted Fe2+/Mn2+ transporter